MKKTNLFLSGIALFAGLMFSSCEKEDKKDDNNTNTGGGDLSGNVEGTLEKGNYTIKSDIIVPAGKTLTLKPGVVLAFEGVEGGVQPEIRVEGNLVAEGTATDPILFTVPTEKRIDENAYAGLWGGIQATNTCAALILRHCVVEYTGAAAGDAMPDVYDAGDPRYAIHFGNPNGVFVFERCTLRNIADDGIRPDGGGKVAIINSVFYNVGETGGEGLNFKDGSVGDVCYNLFYAVATNGSKPAGKGDGVPQTNINTYNNTFINCGHRRVQSGRGGSINLEAGAKGLNYNNLIVNCRFGIRLRGDNLPDLDNTKYGYTHYYAEDATDKDNFWPSTDVIPNTDPAERRTKKQDSDIVDSDPMFVNYDVKTAKTTALLNSAWDFHLKANAPGLTKGKTDFNPVHATLTAAGVTVTIPAPSNFIGAFGTK